MKSEKLKVKSEKFSLFGICRGEIKIGGAKYFSPVLSDLAPLTAVMVGRFLRHAVAGYFSPTAKPWVSKEPPSKCALQGQVRLTWACSPQNISLTTYPQGVALG